MSNQFLKSQNNIYNSNLNVIFNKGEFIKDSTEYRRDIVIEKQPLELLNNTYMAPHNKPVIQNKKIKSFEQNLVFPDWVNSINTVERPEYAKLKNCDTETYNRLFVQSPLQEFEDVHNDSYIRFQPNTRTKKGVNDTEGNYTQRNFEVFTDSSSSSFFHYDPENYHLNYTPIIEKK